MATACSTCLQSFTSKSDISNCCGHVFHNLCVTKWIETGQNNCSEQRKKCTTSQIIKLYFESVNNFINELQETNLKMEEDIKVLDYRVSEANKKCVKLQEENSNLSKNLYDLQVNKTDAER